MCLTVNFIINNSFWFVAVIKYRFVYQLEGSLCCLRKCFSRYLGRFSSFLDRLCGLVVRVSGYRYRGPGFDPRRYQIF